MMAASTLHYTVFWVLLQQEIMEMTTRSLKCRKKPSPAYGHYFFTDQISFDTATQPTVSKHLKG